MPERRTLRHRRAGEVDRWEFGFHFLQCAWIRERDRPTVLTLIAARSLKAIVACAVVTRKSCVAAEEVHRVHDVESLCRVALPSSHRCDVVVVHHPEARIRIDVDRFIDLLTVADDNRPPSADDLRLPLRRGWRWLALDHLFSSFA